MSDLINRDALYDAISDIASSAHHDVMSVKDILRNIEAAPAVDAVPVVRCRDCMYSRMLNEHETRYIEKYCLACNSSMGAGVRYPEYDFEDSIVMPDDYCRYGIARDRRCK